MADTAGVPWPIFRYLPELELAPAYVDETSMELIQVITTVPDRP